MKRVFIIAVLHQFCIALFPADSAQNKTVISLFNDSSVLRFGNSSTIDYFRLLELDGEHMLIGARDVVYNISIGTFSEIQSIKWPSKQSVVNECLMKGKPKDACHNFVRVLAKDSSSGVLVCGTNSFQPMCRIYEREKYGEYRQSLEFSGLGISPYDPSHNSTFLRDGDQLYAGTVSDFSGADPLIHRRNVTKVMDLGIRTERNDVKFLNEPQFAGSFKDEKYAYLWFREQASELEGCGRGIYSRVARLCRSDMGGPRPYSYEWTSFVKARLNCSIPGDYPFYFDQIEAITAPAVGRYSSKETARLVYAVFRSPLAGVSSSAICAFDLSHVTNVFAKSSYNSQGNPRSVWSSSQDEPDPKHRPGTCVKDSRSLSEETVAFARANPLMDDSIQNYFGAPLSVHTGNDHFTQISVDAQVKALDGRHYDVIFVGTDKGNVLKLVNLPGTGTKTEYSAHHIYTLSLSDEPIRNMMLYGGKPANPVDYSRSFGDYLIVVSDSTVMRVSSSQCEKFTSCAKCIGMRDPHCAWDLETHKCANFRDQPGRFQQDIVEGRSDHICRDSQKFQKPQEDVPVADQPEPSHRDIPLTLSPPTNSNNCICSEKKTVDVCTPNAGSTSSGVSSESTASAFNDRTSVAALCTGIGTLGVLFGFVVGCWYAYCKSPSKQKSASPRGSYMHSPPQPVFNGTLPRRSQNASPNNVINAYECTPKFNGLVPRAESPIALEVEEVERPHTRTAWGTSTLPKDYRVKQMYL